MFRKRRGQLFMIEVIVSVSVMVILITSLFAFQNISPPPIRTDHLVHDIEVAVLTLKEHGILYEFFDASKNSFFDEGIPLPETDETERQVVRALTTSLPTIVSLTIQLFYFDETTNTSIIINSANNVPIPPAASIQSYEYYSPGHYSEIYGYTTDTYRFLVLAWYEVAS
jgi:hypothetical protein